ncbi:hypothetical protein CPAST_c09690 [Clostridium pasteurianum DSM 525 = ATCC 6013]|uniref:Uncharacterized protein n=1 Tax=Clostridium pasteurianum DSM 525 = ATCC 6013 TaxID=1262449 RepID=A0A0H3J133_CLOPA|nr:hypothetical protein CPAST_c09690 [Clostridium pasteurianum DSM 525 = ATCC 6013]AJA51057.1 hypothetical protein CLPA_c09690 [Clostridium pasteurianum DSM 525 = ATCC 6013]KRU12935.1 hypothetical protein CP6013_02183 [Clostridium pasteurianum DSM 525 = ATCC 6013]
MRKNLILIVSIILFVVAIIFLWEDNNTVRTIGLVILIIVNLVNIIRGLVNIWHEQRG